MGTWYFLSDFDAGYLAVYDDNYAVAHAQALAETIDQGSTFFKVGHFEGPSPKYRIFRGGVFWTNTGILAGHALSAASIKLCKYYFPNAPENNVILCVVSGEDLANPFVAADYGELLLRTTVYGTAIYPLGSISGPYIEAVLDAAGIAKINQVGTTVFGFRTQDEINSVIPEWPDYYRYCWFNKNNAAGCDCFGRNDPATNILATSATIEGHLSDVYPRCGGPLLIVDYDGVSGSDLDIRFEWWEHGGSHNYTPWVTNAAFITLHTHDLSGLTPDTLHHFNLQVRKDGIVSNVSPVESFTTLPRCSNVEDGYVGNYGPDWDTIHDAASGLELEDTDVSVMVLAGYFPPDFGILRAFLYYDTSDIPPEATFNWIKLALYPEDVFEVEAGCATLHVVEGVQAVPLELEDYGRHLDKIVSAGSIAFGDWVPDKYNEIELNLDVCRDWIIKGGLTKLCLRVAADINDTPLTLEGENGVSFWSTEKGIGYCPKLIINYSLPPPVVPPTINKAYALAREEL